MSTWTLGMPGQMRRQLEHSLPRPRGLQAHVSITPRDRRGHRCPAYDAACYEVHAYYTTSDLPSLAVLEQALQQVPGVYLTTQVYRRGGPASHNEFTNPRWPARLGTARRGRDDLRVQVMALVKDPAPAPAASKES